MALAITGVAQLAACQSEGNPPVHSGDGLLEFGTVRLDDPERTSTQLALYLASPFHHWDYRGTSLINDAIDPNLPFSLPDYALDIEPRLFVRYRNSTPYWFHLPGVTPAGAPTGTEFDVWNQHEILLFARDPHEFTDTIRYLPMAIDICGGSCDSDIEDADIAEFPIVWDTAWGPTSGNGFSNPVPVAASMFYPPEPGWNTLGPDLNNPTPDPVTVMPINTLSFWTQVPPPESGPGTLPDGRGSVKAVKIINHGLCSKFQAYSDGTSGLLDIAAQQLPLMIAQIPENCNDTEIRWFRGGSFLDFAADHEPDQIGGLFLNFNLQVNGIAGGGPNIVWRSAHDFKLFEGRPTVDGESLVTRDIDHQGSGAETMYIGLDAFLTREMDAPLRTADGFSNVAELVWKTADEQLVFPPEAPQPLPFALQPPCVQRAPGDDTILWTNTPDENDHTQQCGAFIASLRQQVSDALDDINLNPFVVANGGQLTAAEQTQVLSATLLGSKQSGGDTVFANFRCASFPDMSGGAHCQYVLPVKRMNVTPDGFELVFIDEVKEPANPVYPIWLLGLAEANGTITPSFPGNDPLQLYQGLCGAPVKQDVGTLGARPFAKTCAGDAQVGSCSKSNNVCTCTQTLATPCQ